MFKINTIKSENSMIKLLIKNKYIYIYINFACLTVCLSVRVYPMNVKTAEQIGPKWCEGPQMSYMNAQNYKKLCLKVLDFC